jgi:hypothetical protein
MSSSSLITYNFCTHAKYSQKYITYTICVRQCVHHEIVENLACSKWSLFRHHRRSITSHHDGDNKFTCMGQADTPSTLLARHSHRHTRQAHGVKSSTHDTTHWYMYTVTQSVMVVVARPGALLDLHLSFFTLLKTVVSCVDKERCYDAALGTECLVLWCFRLLSGY